MVNDWVWVLITAVTSAIILHRLQSDYEKSIDNKIPIRKGIQGKMGTQPVTQKRFCQKVWFKSVVILLAILIFLVFFYIYNEWNTPGRIISMYNLNKSDSSARVYLAVILSTITFPAVIIVICEFAISIAESLENFKQSKPYFLFFSILKLLSYLLILVFSIWVLSFPDPINAFLAVLGKG